MGTPALAATSLEALMEAGPKFEVVAKPNDWAKSGREQTRVAANATPAKLAALTTFGHALGLAFQVIDDILDVTQSTEVLGKTAGKDQAVQKATYPSILGLDASRREAARLTRSAMTALAPLGSKAARLREIAGHLLMREY